METWRLLKPSGSSARRHPQVHRRLLGQGRGPGATGGSAAVTKVIDARSKDGALLFRDPKLNADLNLVFEKIKIVRGMEGYGWFAKGTFNAKETAQEQYACHFCF